MESGASSEYLGLALAALVLLIVLVAAYMCLQLYTLQKPAPYDAGGGGGGGGPERFAGGLPYAPACGPAWSGRLRSACRRGPTTGAMPSIETTAPFGDGLCCGRLGVPP